MAARELEKTELHCSELHPHLGPSGKYRALLLIGWGQMVPEATDKMQPLRKVQFLWEMLESRQGEKTGLSVLDS